MTLQKFIVRTRTMQNVWKDYLQNVVQLKNLLKPSVKVSSRWPRYFEGCTIICAWPLTNYPSSRIPMRVENSGLFICLFVFGINFYSWEKGALKMTGTRLEELTKSTSWNFDSSFCVWVHSNQNRFLKLGRYLYSFSLVFSWT